MRMTWGGHRRGSAPMFIMTQVLKPSALALEAGDGFIGRAHPCLDHDSGDGRRRCATSQSDAKIVAYE